VGVTDADLTKAVSATLLPDQNEKGEAVRWSDPESVDASVMARGRPVQLAAVASEKEYDQVHGFKFQAPVNRQIYVRVNKGLRGFGGYLLGSALMIAAAVVAARWGVAAERKPLEAVARPLSLSE